MSVTSSIVSTNRPISEYKWGENCIGWVFLETDGLSVKKELIPPGSSELSHFHQFAQQFFYILAGTASFIIDGEKIEVKSEEGIRIAPGSVHQISNQTNENLVFILSSQPSTANDRHIV